MEAEMAMRSAELEDLKIKVVSTLLPFKDGATEAQLCQTYRSLLGSDIPFERAGFPTLRDLLHALPLRRNGGRWMAIPDESTNHLAKMISAQKTKTKKKKKTEPPPYFFKAPTRNGMPVRWA